LLASCIFCYVRLRFYRPKTIPAQFKSKIILEKAWNQAYKHADRRALDAVLRPSRSFVPNISAIPQSSRLLMVGNVLRFRLPIIRAQYQFELYVLFALGAGRKCLARTKTDFVRTPMFLMQDSINPRFRNFLSRLVCLARIGSHGIIQVAKENVAFE
jgi:hypothetical protein